MREKVKKQIPIVKTDEHIVCGVVYEPDTEDSQGDMASEEEIRKACYDFMQKVQVFKVEHEGTAVDVDILENYIAPSDVVIANQLVKKGSWVMVARVNDEDVWQAIKKGEITGLSMAGFATAQKSDTPRWPSITDRPDLQQISNQELLAGKHEEGEDEDDVVYEDEDEVVHWPSFEGG